MYKNLKFCLTFYNHVSVLTWRGFLSNVTYPIHLLNIHRLQNRLVYHHIVIYPRTLMLFQFDYQDQLRKEDHKKKMINLNKIWVKISATMVGRRQKIKKKHWRKRSKAVPKIRNLDQNIYDSNSPIWSSSLKNIILAIKLYKKSITRSLIIFKTPIKMTNNFFNNYLFVHTF